jgi:hypothetical protein
MPTIVQTNATFTISGASSQVGNRSIGSWRFPSEPHDWRDRFSLVNGTANVNNGMAKVSIDPYGRTFYIYPEVFDMTLVSVWWDGIKVDFKTAEETPFDEQMAGCCALYVKAFFARSVQKDLNLYESYLNSYKTARRILFSAAEEQKGMK